MVDDYTWSASRCPLWVKNRTLRRIDPMSALPPEADIADVSGMPPNRRHMQR